MSCAKALGSSRAPTKGMKLNLNPVLLEACVASLAHALAAQRAGANRVELCSDLDCGGVTPSAELMQAARAGLRIPIHALIRPRPGNFVYSAGEFRAMRKSIQLAARLRMDGIVLGVLDADSRIDVGRTRELVELAHPLPVTFHRAFDETPAWQDSLRAIIETGSRRLLTSGCRSKAAEALSTLRQMVEEAKDHLRVMPGGGITPANVMRVIQATGAMEVHGSLLTPALRVTRQGAEHDRQLERYYRRVLKVASILGSMATL